MCVEFIHNEYSNHVVTEERGGEHIASMECSRNFEKSYTHI